MTKSAGVKAETEGLRMAAQNQSLPTRKYLTSIIKKLKINMWIVERKTWINWTFSVPLPYPNKENIKKCFIKLDVAFNGKYVNTMRYWIMKNSLNINLNQ